MTFLLDPYAARSCPVKTFNAFDPGTPKPEKPLDESLLEAFSGGSEFRESMLEALCRGNGVIDLRDKLYLMDCGEGAQLQMRRYHIRFNRITHIFISHLHGDHCFGLPGLLSTLGMLGRTGELVVHGPHALEDFLRPILAAFCKDMPYEVRLDLIDPTQHALVMEDRSVSVWSIPLSPPIPARRW